MFSQIKRNFWFFILRKVNGFDRPGQIARPTPVERAQASKTSEVRPIFLQNFQSNSKRMKNLQ